MKWGLLARPELHRGLGIQTESITSALEPDGVLMVVLPESAGFQWCRRGDRDASVFYNKGRFYDLDEAMKWAAQFDIVMSVETFYDERFHRQIQAAGVKTVLYGNPEFHQPHLYQPDLYLWPTSWLTTKIERGPIVPMGVDPAPQHAFAPPPFGGPLKVLHPVGRPALGDRNGTNLLMQALELITQEVVVTVTSFAPEAELRLAFHGATIPDNVTLRLASGPVEDRWDVYAGHHAMVLPRRYGGLCLPVLEAAACGMAIVMPDCSPNQNYPAYTLPSTKEKVVTMPVGQVACWRTAPLAIARAIDMLAADREKLLVLQMKASEWASAHDWDAVRDRWMAPLRGLL